MNTSEFLFKTILDNIKDGICAFDSKGNFLHVNTAIVNIRGLSRQEYLTINIHDIYRANIIDICIFDLVCEQKREVTRLQRYQAPGKASRMKLVTGFPIFDQMGNIQNVITILRDVDSYNKLYEKTLQDNHVMTQDILEAETQMKPIAESPKMKALLASAKNVAALDSTVLLSGESGTGKEVLAHYIHDHSQRKCKPIVEVNCAAFPENLLEAELFGYEKGSFTGALHTGKGGLVEAAHGGTLFLDEINSLPLSLQSKILKLIEQKSIKRIGSVKQKLVDFRLIAATNHDLNQMVRDGAFRADLFYRLNVIPFVIPPLRERREDIIPLCQHFQNYFSDRYGFTKRLSKSVLREAYQYDWPGNVRELRNFLERIMVMTPANVALIRKIPDGMLNSENEVCKSSSKGNSRLQMNREIIVSALNQCGGHRERTAQYLGISRRTLQYKLREFGMTSDLSNETPT